MFNKLIFHQSKWILQTLDQRASMTINETCQAMLMSDKFVKFPMNNLMLVNEINNVL